MKLKCECDVAACGKMFHRFCVTTLGFLTLVIGVSTAHAEESGSLRVAMTEGSVILIDGINLADYMIDHGVGVSVASTYEIKKIDSDFF